MHIGTEEEVFLDGRRRGDYIVPVAADTLAGYEEGLLVDMTEDIFEDFDN